VKHSYILLYTPKTPQSDILSSIYSQDILNRKLLTPQSSRYDVILNATETSGNYWIRAIPQVACSDNDNADNIKGILKYDSTDSTEPTTSAYTYTDSCDDEDVSDLVPYYALDASSDATEDDFAVT
jgi:hypothetical protein